MISLMVPRIMDGTKYVTYTCRTLPATAPLIDIGPPDRVLERTGCTCRGKAQRRFLTAAKGLIALRVGFEVVAIDAVAAEYLIDQLACLDQPLVRLNYRGKLDWSAIVLFPHFWTDDEVHDWLVLHRVEHTPSGRSRAGVWEPLLDFDGVSVYTNDGTTDYTAEITQQLVQAPDKRRFEFGTYLA